MDRELLIANIEAIAMKNGMKPTPACIAAGVGRSFLSDIKRGRTPSVAQVADLAAYLGVTVSDLVGDAPAVGRDDPGAPLPIAAAWEELNEEGRDRLLQYAEDLVATGRYIKNHPTVVGKKEA